MQVKPAIALLIFLTSCSYSSGDQLISFGLKKENEMLSRDILGKLYHARPSAYRIYYYDRDGGKAYVMTSAKRKLESIAQVRDIRIVDDSTAESVGILRRYKCILDENCSSDDENFCETTIELDRELNEAMRNAIVTYLQERAYPVNYVDFSDSPGRSSVTVQYYTDCQYLGKDVRSAIAKGPATGV